jgi:hypothetical protein
VRFHQRAVELLGDQEFSATSIKALEALAERERFSIPASFREWAENGGAAVCEKYCNDDGFFGVDAEVIHIPGQPDETKQSPSSLR